LIQRGHQHIGFLAGPSASYSGAGRHKGYITALQEAGINLEPGWMSNCQPSVDGGYKMTRQLLAQNPHLTALFCFNDLVAVGAIQACDEIKRRISEDFAIVGHDDIPLAALVSPALTTCRVPRHELGVRAVNALLERLRGCPDGCQQIVLQPELIIRESAP
jgi:LacI family purine nucleotide synthesis repressor